MFKKLIEYEDLEEACAEMFGFGNVTFLQDFGPYKKGDKVASLWFHLETGIVEEYTDKSDLVRRFEFELKALEPSHS